MIRNNHARDGSSTVPWCRKAPVPWDRARSFTFGRACLWSYPYHAFRRMFTRRLIWSRSSAGRRATLPLRRERDWQVWSWRLNDTEADGVLESWRDGAMEFRSFGVSELHKDSKWVERNLRALRKF